MIDGIGVVLCFEAKRAVLRIGDSPCAHDTPIHMVGCVELNAGFGGADLEGSAALGFVDSCGEA